jgi:CBS domain-containing protein
VKDIPREEWDRRNVGEVAEPCSDENTIDPDTDAVKALSRMNRTGKSRLMVVKNGELQGIISLKDMLQFLSLKVDLEEEK